MATLQIANGATLTLSGTTLTGVPIRSITITSDAAAIDVTGLDDVRKFFAVGLPNYGYSFEMIGEVDVAIGTEGTAVITWPGGSPLTSVKMAVADNSQKGDVDGAIMTTFKLVPVR